MILEIRLLFAWPDGTQWLGLATIRRLVDEPPIVMMGISGSLESVMAGLFQQARDIQRITATALN